MIPGQDPTQGSTARPERISKECGDISRVIKLLAARVMERNECTKPEIERLSSGVERVRAVAKKLAEIISRTKDKEEAVESSRRIEGVTKVVADVEKTASGRIGRLTQELVGMKRVLQDSIDGIKTRLERQGIPESAKTCRCRVKQAVVPTA